MAHSSQVSEALTLRPNGWDGRTSSTSSATRSVGKSSPITSPNPNPSTMSRPSTQLRFEDVYQSFRVASPVSLFQQQESGPGHPTIDISGRRCLESFERLAPPMSWRRTFAASLVGMTGWFSTRCALTWKVKDTKSSRSYFLLQASTRRTAGTESGLLPTVTATDNKGGGNGETDYQKKHAFDKLKYCASTGMLPTPAAGDGHKTTSNTRQKNLNYLAPVGSGSQLSPLFVEEMMGFPKGWTESPFQSGDESQ